MASKIASERDQCGAGFKTGRQANGVAKLGEKINEQIRRTARCTHIIAQQLQLARPANTVDGVRTAGLWVLGPSLTHHQPALR